MRFSENSIRRNRRRTTESCDTREKSMSRVTAALLAIIAALFATIYFQNQLFQQEKRRSIALAANLNLLTALISDHGTLFASAVEAFDDSTFTFSPIVNDYPSGTKEYILTFVISDQEGQDITKEYSNSVIDRSGYMWLKVDAEGWIIDIEPFSKP